MFYIDGNDGNNNNNNTCRLGKWKRMQTEEQQRLRSQSTSYFRIL